MEEKNSADNDISPQNTQPEESSGTNIGDIMSGKVEIDKKSVCDLVNTKNIIQTIFNSTLSSKIRSKILEDYNEQDSDNTLNIIHRLCGIYQFTGASNMEEFLHEICNNTNIQTKYKLQIVEALFDYSEFVDDSTMSDETITYIQNSNRDRKTRSYSTLFNIAKNFDSTISTTEKVQKTKILMKNPSYKQNIYDIWYKILDDQKVECSYRYRTLLEIEREIKDNILKEFKKIFSQSEEDIIFEFVDKVHKYFKHEIKRTYPTFNAKLSYKNSKFWINFLDKLEYTDLRLFYNSHNGYNGNVSNLFWWEYLENSLEHFFFNTDNNVQYRILSAQYLIISLKRDDEKIQDALLEIAEDNENVSYNLRADAADVLLKGSEYYKEHAKNLLKDLGGYSAKTMFENAQNIHTDELETSAKEILEYFSNIDISGIDSPWKNVNFPFFKSQIYKYLENLDKSDLEEFSAFKIPANSSEYKIITSVEDAKFLIESSNAIVFVGKENIEKFNEHTDLNKPDEIQYIILDYPGAEKNPMSFYMNGKEIVEIRNFGFKEGVQTIINKFRKEKIDSALERIENDRGLYSIYSMSLSNIAIRLWVYIQENNSKEELMKRYIQELIEMSGTCSSGYTNRLANVPSGFDNFNLRMSWEDQIAANFQGRMNARAKKLSDFDSEYYKNENNIIQITNLYLREEENKDEYNEIFNKISKFTIGNAVDFTNKMYTSIEEREIKQIDNTDYKDVVNEYLSTDKESKIKKCCNHFYEKVMMEITNSNPASKLYYSLFFRYYLSEIREELYEEFKEYITDEKFDMGVRVALAKYDGY